MKATWDTFSDDRFYRRALSQLKDGTLRLQDFSPQECNRFARIARKKEDRDRAEIARHVKSGHTAKAKRAQRSYLQSFHARFVAASYATRTRDADVRRRFALVHKRADAIGFGFEPGEMRLKKRPKAGGGVRITGGFCPATKAQQKLIANALTPFYGDHSEQFAQRGRNLAVETLKAHIERAGPRAVFLHGDVLQFYDHVSHDWLRENMPMPASMARYMLTSGYRLVAAGYGHQAHRVTEEEIARTARRGLPQGSVLSPFVAEMVIARIIQESGSLRSYPLVNYSDNFGIVCDADEVQRLEQALRGDFQSHLAGPFDLRSTIRAVTDECRFSGYSFRLGSDGECRFWVREEHWRERFAYFADRLQNERKRRAKTNIERMVAYLRAFPLWEGRHAVRLEWEMTVVSILRSKGWDELIPGAFADPDAPDAPLRLSLCEMESQEVGLAATHILVNGTPVRVRCRPHSISRIHQASTHLLWRNRAVAVRETLGGR